METGKKYIVVDNRPNPRKALNELLSFRKNYDIIIADENARTQAAGNYTENVNIDEIFANRELFQNRKKAFSEDSVRRIIEAVENGTFNIKVFDPVLLWLNPFDGRLYILSGHSRTEAFRRLAVKYPEFRTIPAKILEIDEQTAVDIARNSNTLNTPETDTERAEYYRNLRANGTPEREIYEQCKNAEKSNANRIYKYSFLAPDGIPAEALRQLENGNIESRAIVQSVAAWIGEARRKFAQLTDAHENELFKYMTIQGGYGNAAGQISNERDFIEKVSFLIQRQGMFFDPEKPLNIFNLKSRSDVMTDYDAKVKKAEKDLNDARKVLELKRIEFNKKSDNQEEIKKALKPFDDDVNFFVKNLLTVKQQYGNYIEADRAQSSLFGLGKPYMKLEFDENTELLEFAKKYNAEKKRKEKKFSSYVEYTPKNSKEIKTLDGISDLYPQPIFKTISYGVQGLEMTMELIRETVLKHAESLKPLAETFRGKSTLKTAENIWNFIKTNIRYEKDRPGYEEVRTPARFIADGFGDCDDMSVFAASVLLALGLKPFFYVVAFNGNAHPGHIYVGIENIVLDGVMPVFNVHPERITKTIIYDLHKGKRVFNTSPEKINIMILHSLNGIDAENNLYGIKNRLSLDGIEDNDFAKSKILHLLQGRDREILFDLMPGIAGIDESGNFYFYNKELAGLADDIINLHQAPASLDGLGELGRLRDAFKKAVKAIKTVTAAPVKLAVKTVTQPIKVVGKLVKGDTKGALNIVKSDVKSAKSEVKADTKLVIDAAKSGIKEGVAVAKKVGEFVKNVSLAPMRGAYLVLLKLNFLKHASRLYLGYLSESEAQEKGLDPTEHKKAVEAREKMEKFWKKMGGDTSTLKSAVTHGRGKKIAEKNLNGLGVVVATAAGGSAALAATIIAAVKGFFKNIDFGKMLGKVKDKALDILKKQESEPESNFDGDAPPVTDTTGTDEPQSDSNEQGAENKKNNWLLPVGIVGGLAVLYFITKK